MCKHSRGERESELLFFPLKGEYNSLPLREGQGGSFKVDLEGVSEQGGSKSPFKGDLEGLGL